MQTTINVALTLDQLETIADALEYVGECCEEELKEHQPGSEEYEGLSADLTDITDALETVADAMEQITAGDDAF